MIKYQKYNVLNNWLLRFVICLYLVSWLLIPAAQAQYVALDPSRNTPNGRVLALGKAFVGLADDSAAIFTNPAGLSRIEDWQITSMSGKFLNRFNYLSFSGVYPTNIGQIGFGFAGSSISGAYATRVKAGSDPDDPIYEIDPNETTMQNYNNVYILSYGANMGQFFKERVSWSDKIALGASLKLFSVGLSGDGIVDGGASGRELDLAVQYYPYPWLTLGGTVQNVLPFDSGGRLTYASGHEESYPAVIETGICVNVLGEKDALDSLSRFYGQELKVLLDMDTMPTVKGYPNVWHMGLEWKPIQIAAIRLGIDQEVIGDGFGTGLKTANNFCSGIGLYVGGFRFDYAYHQFVAAPGMDNNYFSLTYGILPPEEKKKEVKDYVVIYQPPDKLLTFDTAVPIAGSVTDNKARYLRINDAPTRFNIRGSFEAEAGLNVGKNVVYVAVYDENGGYLDSKRHRVLRLMTFPDVQQGYWARVPISLIGMIKIITGYPDGTFKPEGNITRAEMATLLMKTLTPEALAAMTECVPCLERAASKEAFKDVALNHWASSYIGMANYLGIVQGYPDGSFKPSANITRAEGLAMIARFARVLPEKYTYQYFSDVTDKHWAAEIIAGSYNAGLLQFLKDKEFEVNRKLTRAEAVEVLYRTQLVQDILNADLLNWDSY